MNQLFKKIFDFYKKKKNKISIYALSIVLVFKTSPFQVSCLLFGIILQGLMPSVSIWTSAQVIDSIVKHIDFFNITLLCSLWGLSLFISNLLMPWIICWQGNIADKVVNRINLEIIKKSISIQSLYSFEDPNLYNDTQVLQSQSNHKPLNLVVTTLGLFRDLITLISCLILLCSIVPWISLVSLISAYSSYKIHSILQKKTWMESLGRSYESRRLSYISSVSLNKEYAKEIRLFNFGKFLLNEYFNISNKIYHRMKNVRFKQAFWPIIPFIITIAGNMAAFLVVVYSNIHGRISIGGIALFLQTLTQLHLTLSSFGEQAGWMNGHILFFEKFFNFMKLKENIFNNSIKQISIESENNLEIKFSNVCFSYQNSKNILHNISFVINPNEKIGIVGLNGAGKSTIIKLICGLYAPTSGSILINNIPILSLDIDHWRKKISPVFQDINNYSFTIEKNIVMSEEINHFKLKDVMNKSDFGKTCYSIRNKSQEMLGAEFGGIDLSKGQLQKMAIARALYKDAPILVLDEPSASLDPISEYEIFNTLLSSMNNKTVILVTHRLSSIVMVDRILLFHDGKLMDDGSHEELMQKNLIYKQMFEKQSRAYIALKERTEREIEKTSMFNE